MGNAFILFSIPWLKRENRYFFPTVQICCHCKNKLSPRPTYPTVKKRVSKKAKTEESLNKADSKIGPSFLSAFFVIKNT